MTDTLVTLTVGNTIHQGWEKVEIRRSLYSLAGTFDLTLSPVWEQMPDHYALYAGENCQIKIGSTPVITGFIDRVTQIIDSSQRSIRVTGRDLTADLVDCSYMGTLRCWQNISLESLVTKFLAPFKIAHYIEGPTGNLFPTWGIETESIFDNLSKAASLRQLLLTTNGKGDLVITKPHTQRLSAFINSQSNVLSAEKSEDYSSRYSHYETRIQNFQAEKLTETNLKVIAKANDEEVKRYRPLLVSQEGEISPEIAKKRIKWERNLRASRSDRVEITLTGWLNRMGHLWDYNQMISISLPAIGVADKYLITGVTFTLDSSGMKTRLECEGLSSASVDPTLESREFNYKRLVEEEIKENTQ